MNHVLLPLLTVIAMLMSSRVAHAEITTVILSENPDKTFTISADDEPTSTGTLAFRINALLPDDATINTCTLWVVPTEQPDPPRADQDVTVFLNKQQVGQWSAFSQTTEPYTAELRPGACAPTSSDFTLQTDSPFTSWDYHGGKTESAANQPRLIVTYDAPSRPNPVHSGRSTDWTYYKPAAFFASLLWEPPTGESLLANPVSHDGAVYMIAGSANARRLYRVRSAGPVATWPLDVPVEKGGFAFVTAWGHLQILTKDAIHSCDLQALGSQENVDQKNCQRSATDEKVTVNPDETPAMRPDGSLYFKHVEAQGSIVARNPVLKELWRTGRKATTVSPMTVSQSGHFAYVLAKIPVESPNEESIFVLLRIDTARGETVEQEIESEASKPLLVELLQPVVASKVVNKRSVDYVFAAGNTGDTGLLQLIAFGQEAPPQVVWSLPGKVAAEPVLSVVDGNSLVVVQNESLKRYTWFTPNKGANKKEDLNEEELLPEQRLPDVITLLLDGGDSVYIHRDKALYVYERPSEELSQKQELQFNPKWLFTADGALIGYDDANVYDFSPKALPDEPLPELVTRTIYSTDRITAPPDASQAISKGDQVILKGTRIELQSGFRWPLGATLKLQSVQ